MILSGFCIYEYSYISAVRINSRYSFGIISLSHFVGFGPSSLQLSFLMVLFLAFACLTSLLIRQLRGFPRIALHLHCIILSSLSCLKMTIPYEHESFHLELFFRSHWSFDKLKEMQDKTQPKLSNELMFFEIQSVNTADNKVAGLYHKSSTNGQQRNTIDGSFKQRHSALIEHPRLACS